MAHGPHLNMPITRIEISQVNRISPKWLVHFLHKIKLVARSGYPDICTDHDASVLLPSGSVKTLDCVCRSLHGIGLSVFSEGDSGHTNDDLHLFLLFGNSAQPSHHWTRDQDL